MMGRLRRFGRRGVFSRDDLVEKEVDGAWNLASQFSRFDRCLCPLKLRGFEKLFLYALRHDRGVETLA
jgi:hypothetical protein